MAGSKEGGWMTFEEWLASVPAEVRGDPLWQMKVYRFALFASDLAWHDVSRLIKERRTRGLVDQLYRAIGSIAANIAEGYSRQSKKDQARFYEYALGSARESRGWYYQGRHILPDAVFAHRIQLLTQIIRLLLTIVPATRGRKLGEEVTEYDVIPTNLVNNPPMP
jgi:four helix bundle protein